MSQARILAFAGSTRKASFNKLLVAAAVKSAETAGAKVTLINLKDFPLPLFDEDYENEHGMPENAVRLKQLFVDHNALLISSPEYNSSVSAVLKNVIDWVSRRAKGEPMKAAFLGKTAAIMAASPGGLGGIRGLVHLRSILQNIGVLVMPDQIMLSEAHTAFNDDGTLNNERKQASIDALTEELVETVRKLQS